MVIQKVKAYPLSLLHSNTSCLQNKWLYFKYLCLCEEIKTFQWENGMIMARFTGSNCGPGPVLSALHGLFHRTQHPDEAENIALFYT